MNERPEADLARAEFDRRAFVKRMAAVAFAIPVVASFKLDSLARATPPKHGTGGHGGDPEQFFANMHFGNMHYGNQHYGNQHYGNQHHPNQHFGNQHIPPRLRRKLRRLLRKLKRRQHRRRMRRMRRMRQARR